MSHLCGAIVCGAPQFPSPAFPRQNDKCLFLNKEKNAAQSVSRAHYLIKAKRIFAAR
jgi:hypothetical protein